MLLSRKWKDKGEEGLLFWYKILHSQAWKYHSSLAQFSMWPYSLYLTVVDAKHYIQRAELLLVMIIIVTIFAEGGYITRLTPTLCSFPLQFMTIP